MSSVESYRASPIKRRRSTTVELAQLDQQIIDVLTEDHPQSVRHVFYRMTDPRLAQPVDKSDRGYRRVQDRCVKLRRSQRLPYDWIADMSRRGHFVNTFKNASDFLKRMKGLYRSDLWRDAQVRCEVWVESRSIASVIIGDCKELAVNLYPCGGFSSISFVHDAATEHNLGDDHRPLIIFYIGDYDPAGVLIDCSLRAEMRRHLKTTIDLDFVRIGINQDQIERYKLPERPRKEGERRARYVTATVEAEAMPARILRSLLRQAIEELLPQGALEVAKIAEESEREHIARMAELFGEGGAQ